MKITFDQKLKLGLLFTAAVPAALSAQPMTLGAMEIAAPTGAQSRTEEALLQFDTSAIESGFNSDFGAGNWAVTSVTLKLFSNVSTAGTQPGNSSFNKIAAGQFELDWLSDNNWSQTAVTWNNLPSLLAGTGGNLQDSLGDFNWLANGASSTTWSLGLDGNMVSDIEAAGTFDYCDDGFRPDWIRSNSPIEKLGRPDDVEARDIGGVQVGELQNSL